MHYYSISLFILLFNIVPRVQCQSMFHKNDYNSLYILDSNRNNGFELIASIVAMFTAGSADRSGFRLGGSLTVSKNIGDWTLSTGLDAYKAKERFGLGTTFAGVEYDDGKYGASYFVNKYYQGGKQVSGILGLRLDDFSLKFEDDILALPFTGFTIYDRYRTAALELQYKHFIVGTNVYTTEINGLTDASLYNRKGTYMGGKQISSPMYIGYTNKDLILRYGINNQTGGYLGQNLWHRKFFDTGDFKSGGYRNQFLQVGTYQPYTLY